MKSIFSSFRRRSGPPTQEQTEQQEPFFSKTAQDDTAPAKTAFFQPKLSIGAPNDPYEQEADAVANSVVNHQQGAAPVVQAKAISSIQRLATPEEEKMPSTNDGRMREDKLIQEKPDVQRLEAPQPEEEEKMPSVQKMDDPLKEEEKPGAAPVQAKAEGGGGSVASPQLSGRIDGRKGKGQALPESTRVEMESAFGTNFKGVNIHTDSEAVDLNRRLRAQAFTHGEDVYFNSGKFQPGTLEGQALLAHELTHVVQQKGGNKREQESGQGASDFGEQEADENTRSFLLQPEPKKLKNNLKTGIRLSRCSNPKAPTLDEIKSASRSDLDKLRNSAKLLDELQKKLSAADFGVAAAYILLTVPDSVVDKEAAKAEGIRILSAQLQGDKTVARNMIDSKVEVVIVPRNKLMTDLPQFASLKGQPTFDGRTWDAVRGSGGMTVDGKVYTAITEENLLGGDCDVQYNGSKLNCKYDEGYSTTSHEISHTLHNFALTDDDKKTISEAYTKRKATAATKLTDSDQWVDGREGCYASQTQLEFFAQLSNAYLGTNGGKDPYTGDTRQNSKEWVKSHEPEVFKVLERIYGNAALANTNPKK